MADAPILIDEKKCVGCGKCVKGCGFGALTLKDAPGANKLGKLAEVDPSACKACYACVPACPFKAISEVKSEVAGTEGLSDYRDIWVFAEQTDGKVADVVFELLTKARELKAQRGEGCRVCAVLLGKDLPSCVEAELSAYGADVIPVDTHVFRLAHRIGLCSEKAFTPDEVEKQLEALIPEGQRAHMHHLLIWHGRRCCKAQKPNCAACPLKGAECAWSLQEQSCL